MLIKHRSLLGGPPSPWSTWLLQTLMGAAYFFYHSGDLAYWVYIPFDFYSTPGKVFSVSLCPVSMGSSQDVLNKYWWSWSISDLLLGVQLHVFQEESALGVALGSCPLPQASCPDPCSPSQLLPRQTLPEDKLLVFIFLEAGGFGGGSNVKRKRGKKKSFFMS